MSKIKQSFVFFKDAEDIGVSENYLAINGNESLIINLSGTGTCSVELQGKVDFNDVEWKTLGVINKKDFSIATSMANNSVYTASVEGLYGVRVEIKSVSEKVTVFANLV